MIISIELPDAFADVDPRYLEEALVAALYNAGKLSEFEAREALGMTRRDFQDLLPRFNLSILSDTPENVEIELRASR